MTSQENIQLLAACKRHQQISPPCRLPWNLLVALALDCKSFSLQRVYSKGAPGEVWVTLTTHVHTKLATKCLLTYQDSSSPHLFWRTINLAILIRVRKQKVERFYDFSPPNGLIKKGNKQNPTTACLASERACNTVQLPLSFGMTHWKERQLGWGDDFLFVCFLEKKQTLNSC